MNVKLLQLRYVPILLKRLVDLNPLHHLAVYILGSQTWKPLFRLGRLLHRNYRIYLTCKQEAQKIANLPAKSRVYVVWDYEKCNCKYGDYLIGIFVSKLISYSGCKVIFAETLNENNQFVKSQGSNQDALFVEFLKDRIELFKFFKSDNMEFWTGKYEDLMNLQDFRNSFVVFRNRIHNQSIKKSKQNRKYTISYYHNMISAMYDTLSTYQQRNFIASLHKPESNKTIYSFATNYRWNPTRPDKNSSDKLIAELIENLLVDKPFYVSTDEIGASAFKKKFSDKPWFKFAKLDGSRNYLYDYKQIMRAAFYVQFHGGGMAASVAMASTMPYVICQPCGHLIPTGTNSLFSFSNNNQDFKSSLNWTGYLADVKIRKDSQEIF